MSRRTPPTSRLQACINLTIDELSEEDYLFFKSLTEEDLPRVAEQSGIRLDDVRASIRLICQVGDRKFGTN